MKTNVQLRKDVLDELIFDPSVSSENVAVSAKDGVITLTGSVSSYADKYSAERAVFRVSGVKAVVEELDVKLSDESIRTDQEVAKAAADALEWNVSVPATVNIKVENGAITLRGEVEWQYQRDAATSAVRWLKGVKSVNNIISIHKRPQPSDIKQRIEKALVRSAEDDAKKIRVSMNDGKVILSGKVRSRAEIQDAKWAAWAAHGVNSVETNLVVE
jgi:osmotically-inducible protein OsmY